MGCERDKEITVKRRDRCHTKLSRDGIATLGFHSSNPAIIFLAHHILGGHLWFMQRRQCPNSVLNLSECFFCVRTPHSVFFNCTNYRKLLFEDKYMYVNAIRWPSWILDCQKNTQSHVQHLNLKACTILFTMRKIECNSRIIFKEKKYMYYIVL